MINFERCFSIVKSGISADRLRDANSTIGSIIRRNNIITTNSLFIGRELFYKKHYNSLPCPTHACQEY